MMREPLQSSQHKHIHREGEGGRETRKHTYAQTHTHTHTDTDTDRHRQTHIRTRSGAGEAKLAWHGPPHAKVVMVNASWVLIPRDAHAHHFARALRLSTRGGATKTERGREVERERDCVYWCSCVRVCDCAPSQQEYNQQFKHQHRAKRNSLARPCSGT